MKNTLRKLVENWGLDINSEEVKENFKWLYNDPMAEFKAGKRLTRELGIKKQGGEIIKLDRAMDFTGEFKGFYEIKENGLGELYTGKVSVSKYDVAWDKESLEIIGE